MNDSEYTAEVAEPATDGPVDRADGVDGSDEPTARLPEYAVPRLLAFYQDLWAGDGTAVGWRPIAWGLRFHDGSALSISVVGRPSVTLWHSVEDATDALDAYVDTVDPKEGRQWRRLQGSPTAPAGSPASSRP